MNTTIPTELLVELLLTANGMKSSLEFEGMHDTHWSEYLEVRAKVYAIDPTLQERVKPWLPSLDARK